MKAASARAGEARMDAGKFFTLCAAPVKANPPALADAPALAEFAKIGLCPRQGLRRQQARYGLLRNGNPQMAFGACWS